MNYDFQHLYQIQERSDNQIVNQMRGQRGSGYGANDGFQIVDNAASNRVIRPSENTHSKEEYQKSVSSLTSFDHTNAHEAVKKAAENGSGIAFIVGSESTRDTQKLLKEMNELKDKNPGMEFVYLDKDKIKEAAASDPNAAKWQDWISKSTNNDNLAFTSLQSVKAGPDGKPVIDRVVSTHWGGDIKGDITDQNRYARKFTSSHSYNTTAAGTENAQTARAKDTGEAATNSTKTAEEIKKMEQQPAGTPEESREKASREEADKVMRARSEEASQKLQKYLNGSKYQIPFYQIPMLSNARPKW